MRRRAMRRRSWAHCVAYELAIASLTLAQRESHQRRKRESACTLTASVLWKENRRPLHGDGALKHIRTTRFEPAKVSKGPKSLREHDERHDLSRRRREFGRVRLCHTSGRASSRRECAQIVKIAGTDPRAASKNPQRKLRTLCAKGERTSPDSKGTGKEQKCKGQKRQKIAHCRMLAKEMFARQNAREGTEQSRHTCR